jgi:hypothetical protein
MAHPDHADGADEPVSDLEKEAQRYLALNIPDEVVMFLEEYACTCPESTGVRTSSWLDAFSLHLKEQGKNPSLANTYKSNLLDALVAFFDAEIRADDSGLPRVYGPVPLAAPGACLECWDPRHPELREKYDLD